MSWFRNDSRKERHSSSTVDMPATMARSTAQWQSGDATRPAAATSAQAHVDPRRAAEEHRAAALERVTRRDDTVVEDAVVKGERRDDDAPAQQREDLQARQSDEVQARQRDDAKALRRDDAQARQRDAKASRRVDAQAQPRDDVPTQPSGDTHPQRPGDAPAAQMNDEQPLPPLFGADVAKTFRARWDAAQIGFVDDPHQAVLQADELVEQMIKSLAHGFAEERARVDTQMDGTVSTENMRVAMRRYRALFQRLLTL